MYHKQYLLLLAILFTILFIVVHVTIFPLNEVFRVGPKLVGEYESSLCLENRLPASLPAPCPPAGIVTVVQGGRLGNQMWEYAAVWAVGRLTGLEPYVPTCIRHTLDKVFVNLSLPSLSDIAHCPQTEWITAAHKAPHEIWGRDGRSVLLPAFIAPEEVVLQWVADIRREFRFKESFTDIARRTLLEASDNRPNVTFIGVHVRRTDYIQYLRQKQLVAVGKSFYLKAMDYFREKYDDVVFVVVSDAPVWCRRHLSSKDVVDASHTGDTGPAQDLAIMSLCNHSIIDYGTYGVWGAILAGGETLAYNLSGRPSSVRVAEALPLWQVLS